MRFSLIKCKRLQTFIFLCFLALFFYNAFIYLINYAYYSHDVSDISLILLHKVFALNKSTFKNHTRKNLYSKCLCHKEFVVIEEQTDSYHITLEDINGQYNIDYSLNKKFMESSILTCDLYKELRRGPNQKVLSFYMNNYDEFFKFSHKFTKLVRILKENLPDWTLRVYYGANLRQQNICNFECMKYTNKTLYNNIDFCDVNRIHLGIDNFWNGSQVGEKFWRFFPIGDDFVDAFITRSVDSCVFRDEITTINQWINSEELFYLIRGKNLNFFFFLNLNFNKIIIPSIYNSNR
jgi:hypothetical protein